jgi:2,3-bisphosphoglycerate-independent phosphoglycerate mutase
VPRIFDAIMSRGGSILLTADHGNCDVMLDEEGNPVTKHSTNRVPLLAATPKGKDLKLRDGGRLADLSPTMLEILGLPQPAEMTGESLFMS